MSSYHTGVQLHPQAVSYEELSAAWREAESIGVDSIWLWDHFFPLYGDPEADHFEGWSLLAAMAADTSRAKLGMLVTCNSYRNPELLADMARTTDHISGGRMYLGIGSGWFERDYTEYGYEFGTAIERLHKLRDDLPRLKSRLSSLRPAPIGDLPLLIGGSGEKVTLRLTAQYADAWNSFGPPEQYAHKSAVLDRWCAEIGRDPAEIERTVAIEPGDAEDVGRYLDAGATHIIVMIGSPFDFGPLRSLLAQRGN
ncbi:MAG: LLM class F420-dependent oxidoreductase [Actinobacteria bacterium]|nr:MAG: LLM class F420-dependent oxidoreductase [Actinomycetota bacterium]